MKPSLTGAGLALGLFASLAGGPCRAAEQPFETVKGWEVVRRVGDTSANPCLMTHGYEDKDDNNAANAIVFGLDGSEAVLVLVYQGWEWDKEERVSAPLLLDKRVVKSKSVWIGDGKTLRTKVSDEIVPNLLAARTIVLRFEESEADFRIPNFAAGYEALRRCDAAANRQVAASVAAPAPPSQQRMAVYAMGIIAERAIRECDVSTSGKLRTAFEAKMAALRQEMAAVDETLRGEMAKQATDCPSADEEPKFPALLRDFIEKSPEEFAAKLDREEAEAKAGAPKP